MSEAGHRCDYAVIGGGSAGCALAARLSEDPEARVVLIEAGPRDADRVFELPGLYGRAQKSDYDWDLQTEPEPGLDGRRAYLPRGRVLGGTSSINTMVYIRGHPADYDRWSELGAAGWSFAEVLPYFLRAEDNERGAGPVHGAGGPLAVSDARSVHPLLRAWVLAANEAGHPPNDDFNGDRQDGVGVYQMTQRDGLRCSAASAYLAPARDRPNLRVLTSARALRIGLRRSRAVAVEVERFERRSALRVEREVIVCAGAYLSPALLMCSGIGPAEHLASVGVRPLVDLPDVGENLQDHLGCFLSFPARTPDLQGADTPANEALARREGRGPLLWSEAGGFLRTREDAELPDVQFHAAPGGFLDEGLAAPAGHALSFGPYVNRPRSRGTVRLRSPLPSAKPRIMHNYLADERDLTTLRDGLRLALEIARQPALRSHLIAGAPHRGIPDSDSDADLDRHIRRTAFSFYHPAGTCAIGRVVDPRLRVLGVEGLRVADTSIMPLLVAGNTNAPAIMIGEKAADLIRADA